MKSTTQTTALETPKKRVSKKSRLASSKRGSWSPDTELEQAMTDDLKLIDLARQGLPMEIFQKIAENSPFSVKEWSQLLNLSERTLQRYRQENVPVTLPYSERILEISKVLRYGERVFENKENFKLWLDMPNFPLGNIKPKTLLDSSAGTELLRQALGRIEHGIFS